MTVPTATTRVLRTFLDTVGFKSAYPACLIVPTIHSHHQHILDHFDLVATHWPDIRKTQRTQSECQTVARSIRDHLHNVPTKVYVLHRLLQPENKPQWEHMCRLMPDWPGDSLQSGGKSGGKSGGSGNVQRHTHTRKQARVQEREQTREQEMRYRLHDVMRHGRLPAIASSLTHPEHPHHHYQWFHTYASTPMLTLTSPSYQDTLRQMRDPVVTWAMQIWADYSDMFDYFVPLDVQQQFERHVVCEHRRQWHVPSAVHQHIHRRSPDAEASPITPAPSPSFTLRIHTPNRTLRENLLDQLMFRITAMAGLHPHQCPHLQLRWFPSSARKRIHGTHDTHPIHSTTNPTPLYEPVSCCGGSSGSRKCSRAPIITTIRTPSFTTPSPPPPQPHPHHWTPLEINTGATYRNTCDTVTIWRMEESHKTFVHEMMHGFGWDFDYDQQHLATGLSRRNVRQWVRAHFRVDPDIEIRLYEAYVESWATLLNVYLLEAYRSLDGVFSKPQNTPTAASERIVHHLSYEQRWAVFQVAKVLHHSGFGSWSAFCDLAVSGSENKQPPRQDRMSSSSSSCGTSPSQVFSQTTSVFSYFIIRAGLLWDLNWFVRSFPVVAFSCNPDKSRTWDYWKTQLQDVFGSEPFQQTVDLCLRWIRDGLEKGDGGDDVLWSMRMGVNEWW